MSALPVIREEHGKLFFEIPEELWDKLEELAAEEFPDTDGLALKVSSWKAEAWARRNRELEGVLPPEIDEEFEPQEEKCGSGLPDCGDVAARDHEGSPYCERCGRQLWAKGVWIAPDYDQ